jgi:phosphoglycerate dehydrogenase-like enzyme
VLARFGIGHDQIDKVQATKADILCTNTPGVLDDSVAEHTISLMLAAARHTPRLAAAMKVGNWTPVVGRELRGRTLAIIGCGPIGLAVARIASRGFGMRVIGFYRRSRPRQPEIFDDLTTDFAAAVHAADFVSLHIPATLENTYFLNGQRLALLPPQAWLLNAARGAVVEEAALYDALHGSRLAGAALDVFAVEPYAPTDPHKDLRALPNTILTPHIGSNTEDANSRMAERALRNIALAGQGDYARMDLLNPEVLERQS